MKIRLNILPDGKNFNCIINKKNVLDPRFYPLPRTILFLIYFTDVSLQEICVLFY
jgi:hypothetical protein